MGQHIRGWNGLPCVRNVASSSCQTPPDLQFQVRALTKEAKAAGIAVAHGGGMFAGGGNCWSSERLKVFLLLSWSEGKFEGLTKKDQFASSQRGGESTLKWVKKQSKPFMLDIFRYQARLRLSWTSPQFTHDTFQDSTNRSGGRVVAGSSARAASCYRDGWLFKAKPTVRANNVGSIYSVIYDH